MRQHALPIIVLATAIAGFSVALALAGAAGNESGHRAVVPGLSGGAGFAAVGVDGDEADEVGAGAPAGEVGIAEEAVDDRLVDGAAEQVGPLAVGLRPVGFQAVEAEGVAPIPPRPARFSKRHQRPSRPRRSWTSMAGMVRRFSRTATAP